MHIGWIIVNTKMVNILIREHDSEIMCQLRKTVANIVLIDESVNRAKSEIERIHASLCVFAKHTLKTPTTREYKKFIIGTHSSPAYSTCITYTIDTSEIRS